MYSENRRCVRVVGLCSAGAMSVRLRSLMPSKNHPAFFANRRLNPHSVSI